MPIRRIDMGTLQRDPDIIKLSNEEIVRLYLIIQESYKKYLQAYAVTPLKTVTTKDKDGNQRKSEDIVKDMDGRTLQLIFLYKYKGLFVHKDLISEFVRLHINAAKDQQVRHLGSQGGWNILNKGAHVPDTDACVPNGYHYLVSIETPNPKRAAEMMKRAMRLNAHDFDDIKKAYNNRCATCGMEEGVSDPRNNGVTIKLQQGHMDPKRKLDIDNTIPQCQYCNQTYKDYFRFNEWGRVIAVNNPEILLQSPRDVQDEMITILLKERQARDGTN